MRYDPIIRDMTWSYSRLTTFENCPYEWLQHYILSLYEEPNFYAQYGILMHDIFKKFYSAELTKDELIPCFFSHFLQEVTVPPPSAKVRTEYFTQGRQYLKTLQPLGREVVEVENKAEFVFASHQFVGFLDLFSCDASGRLYLTDHKSRVLKPRSARKKPTLSDRELDKYFRQLYVYSAAVKQKYGAYPDYLEFHCFRSGLWITEPFDYERYVEVEAWAEKLIEDICTSDAWPANVDYWYCKKLCGFSYDCEYLDLL